MVSISPILSKSASVATAYPQNPHFKKPAEILPCFVAPGKVKYPPKDWIRYTAYGKALAVSIFVCAASRGGFNFIIQTSKGQESVDILVNSSDSVSCLLDPRLGTLFPPAFILVLSRWRNGIQPR
jgi:hypothetical protein